MKYRILVFLFCCFLYSSLKAQKADITVGPPYRVIDAHTKLYFHDRDEVMTVKIDGQMIFIQKFDKNLKFKSQHEYKDLPRNAAIEWIGEHNGGFYLFYSEWDGSKKLDQLFYREIDFANGTLNKETNKLLAVPGKISGDMIRKGMRVVVTNKFNFLDSYDGSKLMIQYRKVPEFKSDKKSHDIIGMHVFGRYFNPIWSKEVTMPYTEKMMNNLDYSVDKDGNAYVLAMVYNDETTDSKRSNKDSPNYHIELLTVHANSEGVNKTPISLQDKFINTLNIFEASDDFMLCAGFYNEGEAMRDADGIFVCKVRKDGQIFDSNTYEISLELINKNLSDRAARKNIKKDKKEDQKASLSNLYFDHADLLEDGSIIMVGEQFSANTFTSNINGRSHTYTIYNYNDILATKISPDGQLVWINKIPKRQSDYNNAGSMSYKYFRQGGRHHFVFLDNIENEDLQGNEVPHIIGNKGVGLLTDYTIDDATGNMKRVNLFNTEDVNGMRVYQLTPSRVMQPNDDQFIVEVYKKKKEDVLLRVNIK
ncbi:hypothetical protein LVD15_19405 [Fulvivirga maritima]|uniref:hypothetical protein n=1 Tax=Fulvivirga maritima TaxID=2904247 RepID=UPI001F3150C9|nr:hypothetical protein [Fulvivirga maritima]UII25452.1 hypothetical protein LVD15_19405 [Fulvivirga maritima]